MEETTRNNFVTKQANQFIAAGVVVIGVLGLGTVAGYTSTALPNLKLSPEFAHLPNESYSWIGSIAPIGACASGPLAGFLIEAIGRKRTLLIIAPVFVAGWLLIGFAKHLEMLYAGRFLTGLGGGTFSLVVPVYVSEIAEDKIRGTLGSMLQLAINVGVTASYVVGYFVNWDHLAFISSSIPVVFFILMIFMPESPRYQLLRKDKVSASKSLQWLRGAQYHDQIKDELNLVQDSIEESQRPSCREMFQSSILKPVGICLALMVFQQWNGNNAIIFYTVDIFRDAGSTLNPNVATIIVGVIQIVASVVSSILMDKAGRRVLLMISGALMTASLAVLGGFFHMKEENSSVTEDLGWLPLLCLVIFIVAFSLGFGPIAWLLAGELLPSNVRGIASALATSVNWLNAFAVTKVFDNIQVSIGIQWCFWVFGIASAISTVFVFLIVPETRLKSLQEIQLYFKGKH